LALSGFAAPLPTWPAGGDVPAGYDAALARKLGADDYGMRHDVLVPLRTGPHPTPEGAACQAMFKGHMANLQRLAHEG